jgi:hypothetical protein
MMDIELPDLVGTLAALPDSTKKVIATYGRACAAVAIKQHNEKSITKYNGWYCAHCQTGVDGSDVTFNEAHTVCGRIITDDEPPANIISLLDELTSLRQYKAEAESQPVFAMAFEKQGMRAPDDFEDYLDIIELEKVNPDELEAYQKHDRVFPLYARPVPAGSCAAHEATKSVRMKPHISGDESIHFMDCNRCGKPFDMRSIHEVMIHEKQNCDKLNTPGNRHPEFRYKGYKGEPISKSASDDEKAAWLEGKNASIPSNSEGEKS